MEAGGILCWRQASACLGHCCVWGPAFPLTGFTTGHVWARSRGPVEPCSLTGWSPWWRQTCQTLKQGGHIPERPLQLCPRAGPGKGPSCSAGAHRRPQTQTPPPLPAALPCPRPGPPQRGCLFKSSVSISHPALASLGSCRPQHPQSEPREGRGFPRSLWRANPRRSLHHVISENRNF